MESFQKYLESAGRKVSAEPKSSAAALQAARRPSKRGPMRARSGHRALRQRLLSENPISLDEPTERFLRHLHESAPELSIAGELARRFASYARWYRARNGSNIPGIATWLRLQQASAVTSRLCSVQRRALQIDGDRFLRLCLHSAPSTRLPRHRRPCTEPGVTRQVDIRVCVARHYVFFRQLDNGDLGVMNSLHERMDLPARLMDDLVAISEKQPFRASGPTLMCS